MGRHQAPGPGFGQRLIGFDIIAGFDQDLPAFAQMAIQRDGDERGDPKLLDGTA